MSSKSKKLKVVLVSIMLIVILISSLPSNLPASLKVPKVVAASTIKLNKESLSVMVGTTYQLKITGTTKNISWKSSDSSVTTVTKNGTVKGIKIGTATITATINKKEYKCKVTVKIYDDNIIVWKDPGFEEVARLILDKSTGDITKQDAEKYNSWFILYRDDIKKIDDIVWFKNISQLYVRADLLKDVSLINTDIQLSIFFNGINKLSEIEEYCDIDEINKVRWLEIILKENGTNHGYLIGDNSVRLIYENNLEDFSDIDVLLKFKHLYSLDLSENDIPDISNFNCLSKLNSLDTLNLGSNNITDISVLKDFINLKCLQLDFNHIEDISYLSNLKNMDYISIRHNFIKDISALSKLYRLRVIELSDNRISDISSMNELNPEYLYLRNNKLKNISSIENMENLLYLDLEGNSISNISKLKNLKETTSICLSKNSVKDWTPISHITSVEGRPE
jgi:Leucine-rich repeat (LRR) protein